MQIEIAPRPRQHSHSLKNPSHSSGAPGARAAMGYIMGSYSPTRRSREEKEQRKSAAKAKIRAIGMVQAAFRRAQQRQGAASPEAVNNGEEEPRLTWRERMAERAKEREGLATARGFDETARSSRSFRDPPSEPSSTQWHARKLEERAKVERRRKEEARARTRRDTDRRARTSDPFEAELDRMSDAEAMSRLDDIPISDLDTDRDSDDDGARSRRTGAVATDEESNADNGLAPMERAMARAARARAATRGGDASSGGEAEARVASNVAAPVAPRRHPPPPRTQTAPGPRETRRRRRGGEGVRRGGEGAPRGGRARGCEEEDTGVGAAGDDGGEASGGCGETIRCGNRVRVRGCVGGRARRARAAPGPVVARTVTGGCVRTTSGRTTEGGNEDRGEGGAGGGSEGGGGGDAKV